MDSQSVKKRKRRGKRSRKVPPIFNHRMVINESTTWPNDRVYTSEERWAVNVEDDISRKDKEHRPVIEEIPHNIPDDNLRTNMNEEKYEHERETSRHVERYDTFNNDNWNQFRNDYDTERYHYNRNAYDNRDDGRLRKDREAYSAGDRDRIRYDEAIHYMRQKYFPGDIRDAPKRMPQSSGGYNHPNDMPSCSRNDGPIISSYDDNISRNHPSDDDLTVIIYKQDESKITFQDADTLRSMLIDLVVNCGNPDQMPEFKRSGIMRSNKGFYVLCRTQETLDWLLKQSLPKLNDVQLLIRRNRTMEIIKVSAFAPKCTRTREEVFKLLKLQNGKKGFNFNNWTMRGYQLSPKGVYMSFDISTDQLRLLQEMHCELSFELKALTFKISRNTVHVVSDFNR
ncbi:hypothetical protein O3M35_002336 [Rhynocoris fuscipes]|uniref:DUF4780 domain-containing protein n=1 Tax=Rhynocoris fuscipes TaxID=488301 RepID=A0AAW1CNH0_9HEMI